MAMPEFVRRYTISDLQSFPNDGNKYELIRGELIVSPAPSVVHEMVVNRLSAGLLDYLRPLGLGDSLFRIGDISWDDETLVQPDLLVIRLEELSRRWSTIKNLRLAVEVISPASRRRDRWDKRLLYQENRVEVYWVADVEAELVEEWRPGDERPLVLADFLRWRVSPEAPLLEVDVPALFRNLPPEPAD